MAVYDMAKGTGANRVAHHGMGHVHVQRAVLDTAKVNDGSGMASDDYAEVLHLPANVIVKAVRVNVLEAEGATLTLDVGDSGSDTRWHAGVDGNSESTNAIDMTNQAYTSEDAIRVQANNAASNARVEVVAEIVDMNPDG